VQLEHLKLKGLKVKQILVFCKNQSVLGESYYGIEHISNGIEHISNGGTHQQRWNTSATLTTATVNTTAAAKTTAAANTTAAAKQQRRCVKRPANRTATAAFMPNIQSK
jgi:hypothetical protein